MVIKNQSMICRKEFADKPDKTSALDEYSDLKITKEFRCKATSPLVKLKVFQPVVVLEPSLRTVCTKMHTNSKTSRIKKSNVKSSLNNSSLKDENSVISECFTPKRADDSSNQNKKPLADRNRAPDDNQKKNTSGIFELSDDVDVDIDVLSTPKKNEYESESDSDSYDYDTVVNALRQIKQKAELNSSQDTSFGSDSSLLKRILDDPEKLSEKVKQSINYKALEKLKKSLEENEASNAASKSTVQKTRISTRKKISIANTRYGSDFEIQTKKRRRKKGTTFDEKFQLETLKLLEKILLNNCDSDSDFESSTKKEFKAKLIKAGLKSEFKKKEKKKPEEKISAAIDDIDSGLDAFTLFKDSWISSDDLEPPAPPLPKSPVKSAKKPTVKAEVRTISSDIKIVQPKNIKFESGLKLEAVFNESYGRYIKPKPKPKSKGGSNKKKKQLMTQRTLKKKSKTFFEDIDEPRRIVKKFNKEEKIERPKIIPYVPLVEVGSYDGPIVEVKDTNFFKDFHPRPNILGRSYQDPKLRIGERRNSSDSDNKYHDTLFHLLKKEEKEDAKPPKKNILFRKVKSNKNSSSQRLTERLRQLEERSKKTNNEIEMLEYENYVGEDFWTNRGKRHVMKNSASFRYPDSDDDKLEDDRSHESTVEKELWDHTYSKRDRPNLNVNWKAQTNLSDHSYLETKHEPSDGIRPPSSFTPSIDTSSMEYSAPNSPLPDSEDTNTNLSGSLTANKPGSKTTTLADDSEDDSDSLLDPIGYSGESDLEIEEPKKKKQSIHFRKMQKKLMRALEKSKGKGRKEKFALVKKFFAEEVFKKKEGKIHGIEHNVKERERRRELRNLFVNLAEELTDLPDNPSKIQILQKAEEQIKVLSRTSDVLSTDLESLRSRHVTLKRRVNALLELWKQERAKRSKLANF